MTNNELEISVLSKVKKLTEKYTLLKDKYLVVRDEKKELTEEIKQLLIKNQNLTQEVKRLENANAVLGGDENKTRAKRSINQLIREIDLCISSLSKYES